MPVELSAAEARRLVLRAQGLAGGWKLPVGKEGAAQAIDRLGYVQLDTIAVIERAHHHVLWTRHAGYRPAMLDELLGRDRRVFEYWTHAAACIPIQDYRYYVPRMRAVAQQHRTRQWLADNRAVVRQVLARIRAEGPLSSADFADERGRRGSWWDWKPAKRALETLFWTGELMIAGRRHFQRLYDLTERVLPPGIDVSAPKPEEVARFAVLRHLGSQGVAEERQAGWWCRDPKRVAAALQDLVDSGEVVPVGVEGAAGRVFYARAAALESRRQGQSRRQTVCLLSPFDSLIIDRRRTAQLFGFDYRLECYTPAPRRKYGYFTLPVLWGDELVGRLDPKADRQQKVFRIRGLVFEPEFLQREALLPALAEAVRAFAAFHGCEEVAVENAVPDMARTEFRRALRAG